MDTITTATTVSLKATYKQLKNGAWGIRVGGIVLAGETITVTKRDGSSKVETIGRVLWTGDGVSICTIKRSAGSRGSRRNNGYGREDCRKYGWNGVVGSSSYYTSGQYDEDS